MVKSCVFGDAGELMVCNGSGFEFQPDKVGDAHPTFVPHETKCLAGNFSINTELISCNYHTILKIFFEISNTLLQIGKNLFFGQPGKRIALKVEIYT